jgi:hypothetical protein
MINVQVKVMTTGKESWQVLRYNIQTSNSPKDTRNSFAENKWITT